MHLKFISRSNENNKTQVGIYFAEEREREKERRTNISLEISPDDQLPLLTVLSRWLYHCILYWTHYPPQ